MSKLMYWTPRILSLAFVGFLSLFAFDVFTRPFEWIMLAGFIVHLLPVLVLLALMLAAWRFPLVGAATFIGFSLLYVVLVGFDRPWSWYAAISGPSLAVGLLYLADWWHSRSAVH